MGKKVYIRETVARHHGNQIILGYASQVDGTNVANFDLRMTYYTY